MSEDFYPFVDSGEPTPDNSHITGVSEQPQKQEASSECAGFACRIAVYDDMLSTPRVIVVAPKDVRSYLEEVTNTVYRCMREAGGGISLMVIREIVENYIHADFVEPIISILDDGNTIRFADQGPGIEDKERAFEFGVTSADRAQKRFIRGTGAGFPMVQQYLENAGGAVSIEDNLHQGTVITVSIDPQRVEEISQATSRGAAVRPASPPVGHTAVSSWNQIPQPSSQLPKDQSLAAQYPPTQLPQNYPGQPGYQPYDQSIYLQPGYTPAYPSMPPAQPMPQGFQQPYFPVSPWQTPGINNGYPTSMPAGAAMGTPFGGTPYLSERQLMALGYLAQHGSGGPTDLSRALGSSGPTWSRELDALTSMGLVIKRGQKRYLTEAGSAWMRDHMQEGR